MFSLQVKKTHCLGVVRELRFLLFLIFGFQGEETFLHFAWGFTNLKTNLEVFFILVNGAFAYETLKTKY